MTDVLTTVHTGTNAPLFARIMRQYVPAGERVADLTYGLGNFWRGEGLESEYRLVRMDVDRPADVRGSLTDAPLQSGVFGAVVLDPPYANNGGQHAEAEGIHRTYNLQAGLSTGKIWALYERGIAEGHRLLQAGGALVVKLPRAPGERP